jgi:hypothetical protein
MNARLTQYFADRQRPPWNGMGATQAAGWFGTTVFSAASRAEQKEIVADLVELVTRRAEPLLAAVDLMVSLALRGWWQLFAPFEARLLEMLRDPELVRAWTGGDDSQPESPFHLQWGFAVSLVLVLYLVDADAADSVAQEFRRDARSTHFLVSLERAAEAARMASEGLLEGGG